MMKILNIVGARPNFMKIAPIVEALDAHPDAFVHKLVHTGQHYDARMSQAFFDDLGLPRPDIDLGVGSGSHAQQTARIMAAFEEVCLRERPDLVVVVGDVNSTIACALVAKKLGITVAHVEAGLRSGDMRMPEEINRRCTDAISDWLYTTDRITNDNLLRENISPESIVFIGNVMIDTLLKHRQRAASLSLLDDWGLCGQEYAVLTLHRPSNVDDRETLTGILRAVQDLSQRMPVIFPMHPRTHKQVEQFGLLEMFSRGLPVRGLWHTEPLGYLEFLHLVMHARLVLTDSGGLQEETTVLGVPCLTLRPNTERPITCMEGTNRLVGTDGQAICEAVEEVLQRQFASRMPERWDGKAAQRLVEHLLQTEIP